MRLKWRWQSPTQEILRVSSETRRAYEGYSDADQWADPVLSAALQSIAIAVSRPDIAVAGSTDHPFARLMNGVANSLEDGRQLRYRQVLQLYLSPKGTFTVFSPDFNEAKLLDPRRVNPVIEGGEVKRYEVEVEGTQTPVEPDMVVWHRLPAPWSETESAYPVGALSDVIGTAQQTARFVRRWVQNDGGIRRLLILSGGLLSDQDIRELKTRLSPDAQNKEYTVGQLEVIAGPGADARTLDLAAGPQEAAYTDVRAQATDMMLLGLRVPKSVAGDASGRTFANAAAEQAIWWEWVIEPLLQLLASGWQRVVKEEVTYDTSSMPAVRTSGLEVSRQVSDLFAIGLISRNEAREILGFEAETELPRSRWPQETKQMVEAVKDSQRRRVERVAKKILPVIRGGIREMETIVLEELERERFLSFSLTEKRLEARIEAFIERWAEEITEALSGIWDLAGIGLANKLDITPLLSENPKVRQLIASRVDPLLKDPRERGQTLPMEIIREVRGIVAENVHLSQDEIAALIRERFDFYMNTRARTIARTESNWAMGTSEYESMLEAFRLGEHDFTHKQWVAIDDTRTRESHAEIDGEVVPIDEPFSNGGLRPLEVGIPEEDINCRCVLNWVRERSDIEDASEIEDALELRLSLNRIVDTDYTNAILRRKRGDNVRKEKPAD